MVILGVVRQVKIDPLAVPHEKKISAGCEGWRLRARRQDLHGGASPRLL